MPRRAARNSFALDRDTNADSPTAPAPIPAAKLPPVEELPPLTAPAAPEPVPAAAAGQAAATRDPAPQLAEEPEGSQAKVASSKPRGSGGRPAGQRTKDTPASEPKPEAKADSKITRIPARVPGNLYDRALPLVKGIGRPSWGQLVSWTCQDHRGAVVAAIVAHAAEEGRRPRGQGTVGTAGNQVTARLYPNELAPIDQVMTEASRKVDQKVTRTMIVLAALEVATATAASQAS